MSRHSRRFLLVCLGMLAKGGKGSGNFHHKGRKGKRGGSAPDEDARLIEATLKAHALPWRHLEFSDEAWRAEFPDGTVHTPIGVVKLGDRQHEKLRDRGRSRYFGLIRPTLEAPAYAISTLETDEQMAVRNAAGEAPARASKLEFIRAFIKPDGKHQGFLCVTIGRDDIEIYVSSGPRRVGELAKKVKRGAILLELPRQDQPQTLGVEDSYAKAATYSQFTRPLLKSNPDALALDLLAKASQLGLFEQPVQVKPHVRKGKVVQGFTRVQKKRLPPARQSDLFGEPEARSEAARMGRLGHFVEKHGGYRRLLSLLESFSPAQKDALLASMAKLANKTPAAILDMLKTGAKHEAPAHARKDDLFDMAEVPAAKPEPKDGDTKTENGIEYRLQDGRWHRVTPAEAGAYQYGMTYRPPGPGAVPKGQYTVGDHPAFRHGVIQYDRPLTDEEIKQYELTPIGTLDEHARRLIDKMGRYASRYAGNDAALEDFISANQRRVGLWSTDDPGQLLDRVKAKLKGESEPAAEDKSAFQATHELPDGTQVVAHADEPGVWVDARGDEYESEEAYPIEAEKPSRQAAQARLDAAHDEGVISADEHQAASSALTTGGPAAAKAALDRRRKADKLRQTARNLLDKATATQNADRQTNTARRARMAQAILERAAKEEATAKTMLNLADAIESGEARHVAGLNSMAAVEMMDRLLIRARHEYERAQGLPYSDSLKRRGSDYTDEEIRHLKLPKPGTRNDWIAEENRKSLARLARAGITSNSDLQETAREYIRFKAGRQGIDPIKAAEMALAGQKVGIDFFPTPKPLAERMADLADIEPGMKVLEPSAGKGNLADAAKAKGAEVDVAEVSDALRHVLEVKGYRIVVRDFMDMAPRGFTYGDVFEAPDGTRGIMRGHPGGSGSRVALHADDGGRGGKFVGYYDRDKLKGVERRGFGSGYDRIIMNPPFGKGMDRQDAAHIQRAYDLLKPGGKLVAIAGEGVFIGRDKTAAAFRDWLSERGAMIEKLPDNSFMDRAETRTTGAAARLVVIEKPAEQVEDTPAQSAEAKPDDGPQEGERNAEGLVFRDGRWHREEQPDPTAQIDDRLDREEAGGTLAKAMALLAA